PHPADATARPTAPSVLALPASTPSRVLAWFFVLVWGSGYLATKTGLQYAPPFTFLSLRFAAALLVAVPLVLALRPAWPTTWAGWAHITVAGLLMHAVNLGGSHSAQYLGMSAGVTALVLSVQPLLTATLAVGFMGERLLARQWFGIALGLAGVALVVWHKIDLRAVSFEAIVAVLVALAAITLGTLYQRIFCPTVDLRAAMLIQFAVTLLTVLPLAWAYEGLRVQWSWALAGSVLFLVLFASILAVNALHTLMRRGQATRVTSLLYLTPLIAVALEWLLFRVQPTALTWLGIAVTCAGVALTAWQAAPRSP
ncbi:MAG TPA: DMT family transporter, partial [Burkholderiaceae bacterium]|nr:DMT family transporter [Burkholderiaceae bacterium]